MRKNVATKAVFFAFTPADGLPKTGDATNITAYVSKDFGAVTALADTSVTEMDATNAKGYYVVDLAAGETNADTLMFSAKSSTSGVVLLGTPSVVFTTACGVGAACPEGSTTVTATITLCSPDGT